MKPEMGEIKMSDDTTTEVAETETEDTQTDTATETDWKAEAEKWKALSRKNENEVKALRPAAQKLAEIEDANKTEIEKAQARAEAAERALQETELARLRSEVALAKGLTPSQAKRLVGTTAGELEADADELLADLASRKTSTTASSDGQGKTGEAVGQTKQITSRDELKNMSREEKLAAYRDGRLSNLMGT